MGSLVHERFEIESERHVERSLSGLSSISSRRRCFENGTPLALPTPLRPSLRLYKSIDVDYSRGNRHRRLGTSSNIDVSHFSMTRREGEPIVRESDSETCAVPETPRSLDPAIRLTL